MAEEIRVGDIVRRRRDHYLVPSKGRVVAILNDGRIAVRWNTGVQRRTVCQTDHLAIVKRREGTVDQTAPSTETTSFGGRTAF